MKKFFLAIPILVIACAKEDIPTPQADCETSANHTPLSVGSYWIYESIQTDTNGVSKVLSEADSVYISGDTTINGQKYFIKEGKTFGLNVGSLLRDSSGYLVNEKGEIRFSETNFTDTLLTEIYDILEDTNYIAYSYMDNKDSVISVPAGTFSTYNYKLSFHYQEPKPGIPSPRFAHRFYADGVGLVKRVNFFAASPDIIEVKLLRYHIE